MTGFDEIREAELVFNHGGKEAKACNTHWGIHEGGTVANSESSSRVRLVLAKRVVAADRSMSISGD